jgi:hypothetical protein
MKTIKQQWEGFKDELENRRQRMELVKNKTLKECMEAASEKLSDDVVEKIQAIIGNRFNYLLVIEFPITESTCCGTVISDIEGDHIKELLGNVGLIDKETE